MDVAVAQPQPPISAKPGAAAPSLLALILAAVIAAAVAPTLTWMEFSNSMENLNVATALEIRRTGRWLIPTLHEATRLAKPPLTAWLTASVITDDILADVSSADAQRRDGGFRRLARNVRLLALAAGAGMLLLTFHIGRLLADSETGLVALVVAGSSMLFLRFTRNATTDINLALWVTATNFLLLLGLCANRPWVGFVGGGAALALAMMAKGPVALIQSLLPLAIFAAVARAPIRPRLMPMLAGLGVFVIAGLAWYVAVAMREPGALAKWQQELSGYQDIETRSRRWYEYITLIAYMAPWCVMFVAGVVAALIHRESVDRAALLLLLVPLLIMSCFDDRYARYMLPILPAAAILTARALMLHLRAPAWSRIDRSLNAGHWIVLAAMSVLFPIGATWQLKELTRLDGSPWLSPAIGYQAAVFAALIIAAAIVVQRCAPVALVIATLAIMLGVQSLFIAGYSRSEKGLAEYRPLAELIWSVAPDAEIHNQHPRGKRPPTEMAVYLNRPSRLVSDVATLTPGQRPKILLILQDKRQPPPQAPAGWKLLEQQPRGDGSHWWAFLMPAVNAPNS